VSAAKRRFTTSDGETFDEGDVISIDGTTGEVFAGEVPVVDSKVVRYFEGNLEAEDDESNDLVRAVDRIMTHADSVRRMNVRANADTGADAARARRFGAEGIGLCRTEHMFLGERRALVETMILADDEESRQHAMGELMPLQKSDFLEILEEMDGLGVTVRLLDPPLHEFLPDFTELSMRVAVAEERGEVDPKDELLLEAVTRLHEENPMLGLRGVRLGIVMPGLFGMQVRALLEATAERIKAGGDPRPEIMVPLVATVQELELVKLDILSVLYEVREANSIDLDVPVGTMIELPRAAVTADEIAEAAEFFSFGTNDLTQMTWGFSRDDVEASFFSRYLDKGIFGQSPFEQIDRVGVGGLVRMAVERGRSTNPSIKLGVCGEHGGDALSIDFFDDVGLDYVSCSPFRVPVARLESGRATVNH
jgi:pyruvate,orthophosphate dikinase